MAPDQQQLLLLYLQLLRALQTWQQLQEASHVPLQNALNLLIEQQYVQGDYLVTLQVYPEIRERCVRGHARRIGEVHGALTESISQLEKTLEKVKEVAAALRHRRTTRLRHAAAAAEATAAAAAVREAAAETTAAAVRVAAAETTAAAAAAAVREAAAAVAPEVQAAREGHAAAEAAAAEAAAAGNEVSVAERSGSAGVRVADVPSAGAAAGTAAAGAETAAEAKRRKKKKTKDKHVSMSSKSFSVDSSVLSATVITAAAADKAADPYEEEVLRVADEIEEAYARQLQLQGRLLELLTKLSPFDRRELQRVMALWIERPCEWHISRDGQVTAVMSLLKKKLGLPK